MNKKLKNCPFCGGEAQLREQNNTGNKLKAFNGYSWKVVCIKRACYLRDILDFGHDTKEYAIKSWNNRELNKLDEVKLSNVIKENIVYKAEGWGKLQKAIMSTFGVKHQAKVDELKKRIRNTRQQMHSLSNLCYRSRENIYWSYG